MAPSIYVPRLVDALLSELLTDLPAVMIVGPRACGKTTTGRRLSASALRLDRPAQASAARADVDAAVARGPYPLLVDEWQLVPEILGAVKRAVDEQPGPGRYIVTGSAQSDLTAVGWPAMGRVIRIPMFGLSERELEGNSHAKPLLDRLASDGMGGVTLPDNVPDIRGYVGRALRGGFPEVALMGNPKNRRNWLASYIDQAVSHDLTQLGTTRDPVRLRRYLETLAGSTAGTPASKTLADAAGINQATAAAYDSLLECLLITERLPAWSNNRINRLVRLPKRYLIDPALGGPLLGIDERAVLRDGDLLGRIIDTFVVAQMRADSVVSELHPRMFHLRNANGDREIDLIAEIGEGRVAAFEIKASSAPVPADARHLKWLRDTLGDRFAYGVVFHTGPLPFAVDSSIWAIPICALWGG